MNQNQINGLFVQPLKIIKDDRGSVLHMLRSDSPSFRSFGEVYFSEVKPGVVKAWKKHLRMMQYFAVPSGVMKLVVYDDRADSPTCGNFAELILGRPDNYNLVIVPPLVWYGFQSISACPSLMANCADLPHDPEESMKRDIDEIKYEWN